MCPHGLALHQDESRRDYSRPCCLPGIVTWMEKGFEKADAQGRYMCLVESLHWYVPCLHLLDRVHLYVSSSPNATLIRSRRQFFHQRVFGTQLFLFLFEFFEEIGYQKTSGEKIAFLDLIRVALGDESVFCLHSNTSRRIDIHPLAAAYLRACVRLWALGRL